VPFGTDHDFPALPAGAPAQAHAPRNVAVTRRPVPGEGDPT